LSPDDIIEQCPAPLVLLDREGRVLRANAEALDLLDRTEDGLRGLSFREACDLAQADGSTTGDVWECERELDCGAEDRLLRFRFRRCAESFAPVAEMVAIVDRTDLSRLREERHRLMEMATIHEVLPTILHELKNPLASIQALVELLTEEHEHDELGNQLHGVLMEIRRMKLSLEGLGFTTRDLSSRRHQAVDYGMREACGIFARQLASREIALETEIETLPLVPLDSGGLRGVLFNLLNNAKQACRAGDRIEVRAGLVADASAIRFSVRDTGKGMSPEVMARCTDLFYTTKRMGSGIGLALCKTAVEQIGGRLTIASREGEGTRIEVTLPIR